MSQYTPQELDLSDLWADAQKANRLHPVVKNVTQSSKHELAAQVRGSELFTLPEYWQAARGIALIHEESRTLIGNFREYSHKRVAGCRKLVRVDEPIAITHTEYIHGWEHLGEDARERFEPRVETIVREILHPDLVLSALGVHAAIVPLKVHLAFGGMTRVELADHTTFSSLDGRTILTLAAGINVLECMSIEAKVAVRQELSA